MWYSLRKENNLEKNLQDTELENEQSLPSGNVALRNSNVGDLIFSHKGVLLVVENLRQPEITEKCEACNGTGEACDTDDSLRQYPYPCVCTKLDVWVAVMPQGMSQKYEFQFWDGVDYEEIDRRTE